jgi:hypothetical protein
MLAAWARGTDVNLFPLCINTAFRLTFEESIYKHHAVGSCRCPTAYVSEQNTRSFLERKIL